MLLVIVHDLDFVSVAFSPHEAETALVVNPNAILPLAIAMQCFQAIARRSCQIAQFRGAVQLPKLSPCDALNSPKAPAGLAPVFIV
jgi:hypothetical protein